jgi:hypothetical protein
MADVAETQQAEVESFHRVRAGLRRQASMSVLNVTLQR